MGLWAHTYLRHPMLYRDYYYYYDDFIIFFSSFATCIRTEYETSKGACVRVNVNRKKKIVCSVRQRRLCTWRCDSYEDYARTCAHSVIKGSKIKTHLWVRLSAVRLAQRPDGNSIWIISILLFRFNVLVNHFSYSIIMNFLFGIRRYSEF